MQRRSEQKKIETDLYQSQSQRKYVRERVDGFEDEIRLRMICCKHRTCVASHQYGLAREFWVFDLYWNFFHISNTHI